MWQTYHVKVEVSAHLRELRLRGVELLDVVVRPKLAKLFSSPEGEADGIVDAEVGEGDGNVQDSDGARAVIAKEKLC